MKLTSKVAASAALIALLTSVAMPTTAMAGCDAGAINFSAPALEVDVASDSDCASHQFSWNAFLALMAPAPSSSAPALYQTYMPIASLFVGEGGNPAAWGELPKYQQLGGIFKEAGIELKLFDTAGEKVLFNIAANEVAYNYLAENKLYNQQCFLNHDVVFPYGSQSSGPGSILLKTAWRVYPLGECPASMICQDVVVDGADDDNMANRSAGMLGMHVVQKTPTHQEWIWASFEHVRNAPDCSSGGSMPIGEDLSWHLFRNSSANQTRCNVDSDTPPTCNNIKGKQTNICRVSALPAGGLDNCTIENPTSDQSLACLNASVHKHLPADSVLQNYRLVGSLRMEPGMSATSRGGNQAGSLALINTSMESFLQGPEDLMNCFSCHAQSSGDFSHVFFRIQQVKPIPGCPLVE